MRTKVTFRCDECKDENYIGSRNKSKNPDRMKIKKFCPKCNKMTKKKKKR